MYTHLRVELVRGDGICKMWSLIGDPCSLGHILEGDCETHPPRPLICFLTMRVRDFIPPCVPTTMCHLTTGSEAAEPTDHGLKQLKL